MRVRAWLERFRSSFFFVPVLHLAGAVVLAQVLLAVDTRVESRDLALVFRSSVDNSRALLSAIAGATITVAGIVFSVTMIAVQLASSQFSPRVLRGFLRDRFQQHVMGYLVATFAYSLLVLRAVRAGDEQDVIPNLSVTVALLLGVGAVIAILAYIDHTARSLQVSHIIRGIADETVAVIRSLQPRRGQPVEEAPDPAVEEPAHTVRARGNGWLQQLDLDVLCQGLPPRTHLLFQTRVGRFVTQGATLAVAWPVPPDDVDVVDAAVEAAIRLGKVRTMQQDISFGFRQLVDIALRALSPSINDPATAYEVIVHLRTVLFELLQRDLPRRVFQTDRGQVVILDHELDHDDYVARAFNQVRQAASEHPEVALEMIKSIGILVTELVAQDLEERTEALRGQVRLLLDGLAASGIHPDDVERVRGVAERRGFAAEVA